MRAHIHVSGLVQGVFYRASAQESARSLGLDGWVRNLPDGRVEIVAEGPREKLEALAEWCREGPPFARVQDVDVSWEPHRDEFTGFSVTR
ncbi:MAG: acylphosphatase [Planctomycetota bacterium]